MQLTRSRNEFLDRLPLAVMQKRHHNMKQTILILFFFLTVLTSFGQTWQNVGSEVNDKVYDLIKFDNKLYAGGRIGVKYWDGSTWSALPNPFGIAHPLTLAAYNDTLYVGGDFPWSGSISHVYKYNGASWSQVGGDFNEAFWSSTKRLLTYNGLLISGGRFSSINGTTISNIASWNGTTWDSLGNGLNGSVWNLAEHNGQLISGGRFSSISGTTIYNIASWNGTTWDSLGNGLNGSVWNLAEYNGQLIASGDFTSSGTDTTIYRIAKWDGLNWSPIDTAHKFNSAGPMISFNENLIIGNVWDTISGNQMKGVAEWTGSTFISMGNNLIKSVNNFWTFNSELYLSGKIYNFNPTDDDDVVLKWNGFFWQQVGQVFDQPVLTVDDFDNEIFCGGFYTTCGPSSIPYIAKVNMTTSNVDYSSFANFNVFPNPTFDDIIFETTDKGIVTISNQLGQIIKSIAIADLQTIIETADLNAGVYFINFHSDKKHSSIKLIKQ